MAMMTLQVWTNIDGASSSVYRLNGTMENNNQSIRCLVINTGGETYSETFVVRIAAAQSPSANPSPNSPGGGARYTLACMHSCSRARTLPNLSLVLI
jgi:hypothetical protein